MSVLLAIGIVVAAGLPIYVFPKTDRPTRTDVIFVLNGPSADSRTKLALKLLRKGLSHNLIISTPGGYWPIIRCKNTPRFDVYCETPKPGTTQGEARILRALANAHGWKSATVITIVPHTSRARMIIQRCFTGSVTMVADPINLTLGDWIYQYAYQSAGFAKALLDDSC